MLCAVCKCIYTPVSEIGIEELWRYGLDMLARNDLNDSRFLPLLLPQTSQEPPSRAKATLFDWQSFSSPAGWCGEGQDLCEMV